MVKEDLSFYDGPAKFSEASHVTDRPQPSNLPSLFELHKLVPRIRNRERDEKHRRVSDLFDVLKSQY
jgi:hypothetical protein